jgi:hypothetical protein
VRMIPAQISPATRSSAEHRLFKALARVDMPQDWACLHSVDLPEHMYKVAGELDFVIIGPRGLYVLEVKGGGVSCDGGIWSFTNRWGEVARRSESPFRQAHSGMHALRERLLEALPEHELGKMVMGYGVVFPDCDFDMRGVEWPPEVVLDARRWRDRGLRSYLENLASYWHGKLPGKPDRVSPELVRRVVGAIRPDFELARSLQVQSDEIEGRLVRLTEEQYAKLDFVESFPRILVEGGAGTGKTFLAAEIARRHAAAGQRALLVCFSPVLAAFLGAQTREYSIAVESVHGLMLDVVRKFGKMPPGYVPGMPLTHPWFREQLLPAFEVAARGYPGERLFDVLIIDEAQDILNLDYLVALGNMLRGGLEHGTWRIFYDGFNQGAIFGAVDPTVIEMLSDHEIVAPRLHINCRNTDEIVIQTKLLTGADIGNRSVGPGPKVVFETYRDEQEAAALLQAHLEELWDDQVDGSDITILSPRPYEQSSVRLLGDVWRRRIARLEASQRLQFPSGSLTFSTVANFKGLENRFVALTDIEDLDSTPAARATVYVGMSRARVGLWVAMHEGLRERHKELAMLHLPLVMEDMSNDR